MPGGGPGHRRIRLPAGNGRFAPLVAFDVDDLAQGVADLDQVGGIAHDNVDVFVRARYLVQERVRPAPLDAPHGRFELTAAERLPGCRPAVETAGAVR